LDESQIKNSLYDLIAAVIAGAMIILGACEVRPGHSKPLLLLRQLPSAILQCRTAALLAQAEAIVLWLRLSD
jgi:hypothetical protein